MLELVHGYAPQRAPRFAWTDERDARLRTLCDGDLEYTAIAIVLGAEFGEPLTRKSVSMRAHKIGIKRRDFGWWKLEHDEYLKDMIASPDGYSYSIMAEKINGRFETAYSKNAVIGRVHRLNIKRAVKAKIVKPRLQAPRRPRIAEVQVRCAEIQPHHVSIVDVTGCRWPYGEGPFTFCNHEKFAGSYCAAHYFLSIGPGSISERTAHRVSERKMGSW